MAERLTLIAIGIAFYAINALIMGCLAFYISQNTDGMGKAIVFASFVILGIFHGALALNKCTQYSVVKSMYALPTDDREVIASSVGGMLPVFVSIPAIELLDPNNQTIQELILRKLDRSNDAKFFSFVDLYTRDPDQHIDVGVIFDIAPLIARYEHLDNDQQKPEEELATPEPPG